MNTIDYKNLLLKTAVAAISCDGDIDDREIEELKNIEKSSAYFSSEDLSKTLEKSLSKCKKDTEKYINSIFSEIKKSKLNILQEMTLIEISLRIILADEKEEDSEKKFISNLRKNLNLTDFLIHQRFGSIDYLGISYQQEEFTDIIENNSNNIENTETKNK